MFTNLTPQDQRRWNLLPATPKHCFLVNGCMYLLYLLYAVFTVCYIEFALEHPSLNCKGSATHGFFPINLYYGTTQSMSESTGAEPQIRWAYCEVTHRFFTKQKVSTLTPCCSMVSCITCMDMVGVCVSVCICVDIDTLYILY